MKKYKPAPAITLQQLKDSLDKATPQQLALPVQWWGDDRGGFINEVWHLEEDYGLSEEGYEPLSSFEQSDEQPEDILPKGSIILLTDQEII